MTALAYIVAVCLTAAGVAVQLWRTARNELAVLAVLYVSVL